MTGRQGRPPAPALASPLSAASRDASWYDRPNTRTVKVLHIATVAGTAACAPGPEHVMYRMIPLDEHGHWKPEDVYDDLRCRRSGCRVHWAKVPSKPRATLT